MDRVAWRAGVPGSQSWTQLSIHAQFYWVKVLGRISCGTVLRFSLWPATWSAWKAFMTCILCGTQTSDISLILRVPSASLLIESFFFFSQTRLTFALDLWIWCACLVYTALSSLSLWIVPCVICYLFCTFGLKFHIIYFRSIYCQ